MKPIITLCRNTMKVKDADALASVYKMCASLGLHLTSADKELEGKPFFKMIFQKWINAAEALLEQIIMKLPSPKKAQ